MSSERVGSSERRGDWFQTATGKQFWPLDPHPDEVCIEDIAHHLANQCRFAGACRAFYSVAQHSVLVSCAVPSEDQKWGLLHDAAEAYLQDLIRPIKAASALGEEYRKIEDLVLRAVCEQFGLPVEEPLADVARAHEGLEAFGLGDVGLALVEAPQDGRSRVGARHRLDEGIARQVPVRASHTLTV